MIREMFEVRFYATDSEVVFPDSYIYAEEFEDMSEALARAREVVELGYYPRAIVDNGIDDDIYDTARDEALKPSLMPLPEVAPLGPRQRHSALAERVLV